MTEALGGKPVSWDPPANWEDRARRIAAMLRQRQEQVRFVGVTGDYACGNAGPCSILTLVVFLHDWRPDYHLGTVQAMEEMPVALDWVTDAYLVDIEAALADDVRAHRLATVQPVLTLDRVVRDVLVDFRDQYFSHDERARRVERLLEFALKRLGQYEAGGPAVEAAEAFLWGYGPALCHLVDEPPSTRRLLERFAGAARVRRLRPVVDATRAAFALDDRDQGELAAALQDFQELAEDHVRRTRNEAVGGLTPQWASTLAKARRAHAVLRGDGDDAGAAWALIAAATTIDRATEHAVPGFRACVGYGALADAIFGRPPVAPLRHAVYEIKGSAR